MRGILRLLGLTGLVLGLSQPAAAQTGGLPGGASSLNETHGDWVVICAVVEGDTRCLVSQTQSESQSGQRVLTVELVPTTEPAGAAGVIVLPFGLALGAGASLTLDEKPLAEAALPFSTCLPIGCLVPLELTPDQVTALQAGTTLSIASVASDSGQEVAFSVSLTGFTSAIKRAGELLAP